MIRTHSLVSGSKPIVNDANKQTNKPENVIPILFTIEQMQINKKNSNRSQTQTHTHLYTNKQTTDRDMLLENIKSTEEKTTLKHTHR